MKWLLKVKYLHYGEHHEGERHIRAIGRLSIHFSRSPSSSASVLSVELLVVCSATAVLAYSGTETTTSVKA